MMRAHCDRCDKLVDHYPTWFEERMNDKNKIYHININVTKEEQFCRDCVLEIVSSYLKIL